MAIAEEQIIDSVIAAVDDEPITLHDLSSINGKSISKESLQKGDQDVQKHVDLTIHRYMMEQEAKSLNITVSPEEVETQINALAARNNLTPAQFQEALKQQGQSLETIKNDIRFQILQMKVVATELRSKDSVTEEEIQDYVKQLREKQSAVDDNDNKIVFNYIIFKKDLPDAINTAQKVADSLAQGVPFSDITAAYGENSTFGIDESMPEEDLIPSIKEALNELNDGENSEPIMTEQGLFVIQKGRNQTIAQKTDAELREEAKAILESRKLEKKAEAFVLNELPKKHTVELAPEISKFSSFSKQQDK